MEGDAWQKGEGEKFGRDRKEKAHKERGKQRKGGVNLVMKQNKRTKGHAQIGGRVFVRGFERRCVEMWIGDAAYSSCTLNLQLRKDMALSEGWLS